MVGFEIRYLIVAPISLVLLVQFIALQWLDKRVPRWSFAPLILVFAVQDVAFNLTLATWIFWQRPRELLLTTRLKGMGADPRAARFALVLNYFDEGHV